MEPYRAERADSAAYGDDRPGLEHMLMPDAGDEAIDEGVGKHRPQRNQGDRYRRHPRERGQLTSHKRGDRQIDAHRGETQSLRDEQNPNGALLTTH